MQTNIVPFQFKTSSVRVAVIDGEPWWFAKDVCELLGLENTGEAVSTLDDTDKKRHTLIEAVDDNPDVGGIPRTYVIINEPGVYTLILKSRKPEAREFKRWLTREVIPSIRKTGSYAVSGQVPSLGRAVQLSLLEPEFCAAQRLAAIVGITDANQVVLSADGAMRKLYGVSVLETLGHCVLPASTQLVSMTPTELGEELGGMHPREVNKLLESIGLQTRVAKEWIATERGEEHTVRVDVQKRHNSGAPCTQLRWYSTVIDVLRDALNQRRAGATAGTRAFDGG
jgi:prophage antirepressor-like protein